MTQDKKIDLILTELQNIDSRLQDVEKNMATKQELKSLEIATGIDLKEIKATMVTKSELKEVKDIMVTKSELKEVKDIMVTKSELKEVKDTMATKLELKSLEFKLKSAEKNLRSEIKTTEESLKTEIIKNRKLQINTRDLLLGDIYTS